MRNSFVHTLLAISTILTCAHCVIAADFWMRMHGLTNNISIIASTNTYVWIPAEVNQLGWSEVSVGYGTGSNPESYEWSHAFYYEDGDNTDKRVAAPVLFQSTGTYYYAARGRILTNDAWSYANTTNWGFVTNFQPELTITILPHQIVSDTNLIIFIENDVHIVWNSDDTNSIYDVEWASSLTSTWYNSWNQHVGLRGNLGITTTELPRYYRVKKSPAYQPLQVLYVSSNGNVNHFTNSFERGYYTLIHSGVFRYNIVGSSELFADGEYAQDDSLSWTNFGGGLTLHVNDADLSPTRPDVFSNKHEYDFVVIGSNPLRFRVSIYDPLNYTDNDGGLYVRMISK